MNDAIFSERRPHGRTVNFWSGGLFFWRGIVLFSVCQAAQWQSGPLSYYMSHRAARSGWGATQLLRLRLCGAPRLVPGRAVPADLPLRQLHPPGLEAAKDYAPDGAFGCDAARPHKMLVFVGRGGGEGSGRVCW